MTKIVLTRFPLESDFGGEEKIIALLSAHFPMIFWTNCKTLKKILPPKKVFPAFFVRDITAKKTLFFSPIFAIFLIFQSFFFFPFFRFSGARKIIFHTFLEKIFLTPIAKFFGFEVFWAHHAPLGKWFFRHPFLIFWKIFSRFSTILVPTHFLKNELLKGKKNLKIVVVENPAENFFGAKIRGKNFVVGAAGRLAPEKHFEKIIKIAEKLPEIDFKIAGDGAEKNILQKIAPKNVEFLGFLAGEKYRNFWRKIDVFVSFSDRETFGIVAAEAARAGVPAIVVRAGGFLEIVKNGETGFFVADENDAIAKIKCLKNDEKLRQKMQKKAKKWGEKFSEKNFLKKMEKILGKSF